MSTNNTILTSELVAKDYKSGLKPVWCPGCGDFGVLNGITKALTSLQIPPHDVAVISGIGCSSRLPGYLNTYGFNAVHGRALPIASGVKLANDEITVLAVGGDGDGISIGAGHFPHAARRNIDMTYVLMDNRIYGLTKGQSSPTTEVGANTKTTSYGAFETPMNPAMLAIAYNASFVARSLATDTKNLVRILEAAIEHRGFSFVQVFSRCITFRGEDQFMDWREKVSWLCEEDYDPTDRLEALRISEDPAMDKMGILYRELRPTWTDHYQEIRKLAMKDKVKYTIDDLTESFRP
ncbi:MAG: 2-oxoacid:ferredoxin oxidoreductase subunit beta [Candidatus Delongbacteria bacterium]|nr:2-oxoacid:ferredoxin oxidoreductase subunit beta [bacterium]MBL7033004.1 2-oxoacid:ferredoxin oxidoreductase subunit beta [Candidatus Delongbacteria bacterium]